MTPPARLRDALRTALAVAAILPGLGAGLAGLLATRDRRRAANRALAVWADLGLAAAGVRLAVRGREHLAQRPAVFVFNHQSGIDPLLVCALLRRDFVGVAKREIRRNPLLGPAFALAGTLFVDRLDRDQALRALEPGLELLARGTAVAITPEGTRSADRRVGPFKKGAFRLAMAAGVPVVPCIIHDAHRVLPRRGWVMRPGTVHVTVQAPVATRDWSAERLDGEIEAVRARFVAALGG